MYLFRRAIGAFQGDLAGLQPLNIENSKLSDVVLKTRALYITVYDKLLLKESTIDMNEYRTETIFFKGTIQDWLDTKEKIPLKVFTGTIGGEQYHVRMEDMQLMGYKMLPARLELAGSRQSMVTSAGAKDILVKHIEVANPNYVSFVETTLFTYNGYFVRAHGRQEGIYLEGAGKNFQINDQGHVGALDFKGISKIETIPFKAEAMDIQPKKNTVHVTLDRDMLHETIWFVIAGKLICGAPAVTKTGPNTVRIDLRALDLGRLLIQSAKHIDLDNIANCTSGIVEAGVLEEVSTIEKLFTNFNSFLVALSNPYMGIDVSPLEQYTFPTTFATQDRFHHPVMLSDGRFPTYRHRDGAGRRLLDFDVRLIDIPMDHSTGSKNGGDLFHDKVNWDRPHTLVEAYHFKIYSIFKDL
ncbi:hypothetical protein [Vibrio phage phiKT1028]|nr:hypothetical protein [Vibrio phage phiKT1028]